MNPEYLEKLDGEAAVFRNYEGRTFRYPLGATPVHVGEAATFRTHDLGA